MEETQFLQHLQCPNCTSRGLDTSGDNLALYQAEESKEYSAHCFSCKRNYSHLELQPILGAVSSIQRRREAFNLIPVGTYRGLKTRGISQEIACKFKYSWSHFKGELVQVASFYKNGLINAQKIRTRNKHFFWLGKSKEWAHSLFGKELFSPNPNIAITVVEGEIDTMTIAQVQDCRFPVVGLLSGAGSAYETLKKNKEYLDGFKYVVLMFDGDMAGREAAEKCKSLFSADKLRIAELPEGEDPNKMYLEGREKELIDAFHRAKVQLPDDIVKISDYSREELYTPDPYGHPLPFPQLNQMLHGLKGSRLYTVCAGSGLGKSTVVKEVAYHLAKAGLVIGNLFLEQDDKEAMRDFIAMDNNCDPVKFNEDPSIIPDKDKQFSEVFLDKHMYFFKHFGSLNSDSLLRKIEYMMVGLDCDVIMLDHISMVIAGEVGSGDERKDIDVLMTKLRALIQRTQKSIICIVHLKRPRGDVSYNNGAKVQLSDLRGSASIEQLSDFVIALERNQFDKLSNRQNISLLKLLKNRRGGKVGYADTLKYNAETGRLKVIGDTNVCE